MTLNHIFLLYTKFKNTNLIKNAYETLYTLSTVKYYWIMTLCTFAKVN